MYWSLNGLPELQHLSEAERGELLRKAVGRGFTARLFMASAGRGLATAAIGMMALGYALAGIMGVQNGPGIFFLFGFVTLWGVLTVLWHQYALTRYRGQIRIYLEELKSLGIDSPVCLKCGYALHDGATRCGECGTAV